MNVSQETIDYLKNKHQIEFFDLSELNKLIELSKGYKYEFQKDVYKTESYYICKCGAFFKQTSRTYGTCLLCGNKKFIESKSLKYKESFKDLTKNEQEELPFTLAREIKLVSDIVLEFNTDEKKIKLGKFKVNYKLDIIRKKIHMIDLLNDIKEYVYKDGLWYEINSDGNYLEEQSYANMFITLNSLLSSIKHTEAESFIEKFLNNYNLIVEKEKQIYNFKGLTMGSLFISLLSRNFYVICEFFKESFTQLYYSDFNNENENNYYSKNKKRVEDKIISKSILQKYFKPIPLNHFNFEIIDKQFNRFSENHIMGEEIMNNGKITHQNVYKILDLPKTIVQNLVDLKHYKKVNKANQFAQLVSFIKKHKDKMTLNSWINLINVFGVQIKNYEYILNLLEYHPMKKPEKIVQYLKWFDDKGYINMENAFTLYRDYIRMSNEVNIPYNVFPKNLKKVHDIRVIDYNILQLEKERKKEKKKLLLFEKIYSKDFEKEMVINEEYTMLRPISPYDLIIEGQSLNHCVGSYAQSVLDELSLIFFLRRINQKEKSLVTVELNPKTKKIVQKKGKFNRSTSAEENKAISEWYDKYLLKKNEKKENEVETI